MRIKAASKATTAISWPDARLVRECLKGNEEAWAALIDKYKNLIFSIPLKCGLSRDDAADVFQSIFLNLLSELPRLRDPQALSAWLIRVTYHRCLQWKREQERYIVTENVDKPTEARAAKVPEDLLREVELEQAFRVALAEMSPRCRQLIQMLFFENPARPYEEVAASLGLAKGSIGFIRGRCLKRLRDRLEKAGFK